MDLGWPLPRLVPCSLGFSCSPGGPFHPRFAVDVTMFCVSLRAVAEALQTACTAHSVSTRSPLPREKRRSPNPWREMLGFQSCRSPRRSVLSGPIRKQIPTSAFFPRKCTVSPAAVAAALDWQTLANPFPSRVKSH